MTGQLEELTLPVPGSADTAHVSVPDLVAKVYEAAPATERSRLLRHLMRPLGILSLAVVANGVFARFAFPGGWSSLGVRPEDTDAIRPDDVAALVEFVQQASSDIMDGLVQLISASPVLSGTAVAAVLVAVLLQRARRRRGQARRLV